jgi:hypothetical protein
MYAIRAAYQSTAPVNTDHCAALDAVTGNALRAHTLATGGTMATPIVELTRHAIRSWRGLAGLDNQGDINWTSVDSARQLIAYRHKRRGSPRQLPDSQTPIVNRASTVDAAGRELY